MSPRLTIAAAVAVITASLSLNAVVASNGWLTSGIGAVVCVALAGTLTRLSVPRLAIGGTLLVLIATMPMFTGPGWYPRVGGLAIVAAVAACALAGRLRWITVLATYLAALLVYLNLVFASRLSFGLVIPTNSSLSFLAHLPSQAFTQFGFRPPVTDTTAVSFFAAAGIGLVAICVDIFAVWLRRPAIAGLPLLALFSVPVASNLKGFGLGESLTFAAGLAGFLVLLASEGRERLRMWGRLVSFRYTQSADEAGPGPDTRDIAASGRRIGLAAVCLAILVPLVLPTMQVRDVFAGPSNGDVSASGASGAGELSPLLDVAHQLTDGKTQTVLSYTTTGDKQSQQPYMQVYALNYNKSKNEWLEASGRDEQPVGTGSTRLPAQIPGLTSRVPTSTVVTTVKVAADQQGPAYLPAPYAPVQLKAQGFGWQENASSLTVFSSQPIANLSYKVTSRVPDPTFAELNTTAQVPANIENAYGSYTGPDQSKLSQIALGAIGTETTNFEKAEALQDWFLSNFTYSLKPGLPDNSGWIVDFLTRDKRGFCQQFAWAFAVLARLLQIPTRIAVGYTAGSYDASTGKWTVTSKDAHAWPEIYVPGVGWVRMEPTPGGARGQGTAVIPGYASGKIPGTNVKAPAVNGGSTSRNPNGPNPQTSLGPHNSRFQKPTPDLGGLTGPASKPGFPWPLLIPVAIVLLLAFPGLGRIATRRRRWLTATGDAALADAAWKEMTDDLADYGFSGRPSETPRALVRRLAREAHLDDHARDAVRRIGTAEERARYAASPRPGAGLRGDVRTVRQALAAQRSWSQRQRARLLPASTLATILRAAQRTGDLFGWLDTSWPSPRQIRRSLTHRSAAAGG
jgi:transglutaminase-like putative cysteine protease